MKLLRWAAAGASVYVVYKYTIGKKSKGEEVFTSPERDLAESDAGDKLDSDPATDETGDEQRLG